MASTRCYGFNTVRARDAGKDTRVRAITRYRTAQWREAGVLMRDASRRRFKI